LVGRREEDAAVDCIDAVRALACGGADLGVQVLRVAEREVSVRGLPMHQIGLRTHPRKLWSRTRALRPAVARLTLRVLVVLGEYGEVVFDRRPRWSLRASPCCAW
jgi:hypothetical protein